MVPTVRMRVTVGERRGEALPQSLQVVLPAQAAKLNGRFGMSRRFGFASDRRRVLMLRGVLVSHKYSDIDPP